MERLAGMEATLTDVRSDRADRQRELAQAQAQRGAPFKAADELSQIRERLAQIARDLAEKATPPPQPSGETPSTGAVASVARHAPPRRTLPAPPPRGHGGVPHRPPQAPRRSI